MHPSYYGFHEARVCIEPALLEKLKEEPRKLNPVQPQPCAEIATTARPELLWIPACPKLRVLLEVSSRPRSETTVVWTARLRRVQLCGGCLDAPASGVTVSGYSFSTVIPTSLALDTFSGNRRVGKCWYHFRARWLNTDGAMTHGGPPGAGTQQQPNEGSSGAPSK